MSYVICLSNTKHPASLEARKVYLALPDKEAEQLGLIRVVDESGEDYLFPRSQFAAVTLPRKAKAAFLRPIRRRFRGKPPTRRASSQ